MRLSWAFWATVLSLMAGSAAAEDWERELSAQVLQEHECEVAFLSQVMERNVNGERIILAKVHCIDKRTFDAVRTRDIEFFEFHPLRGRQLTQVLGRPLHPC